MFQTTNWFRINLSNFNVKVMRAAKSSQVLTAMEKVHTHINGTNIFINNRISVPILGTKRLCQMSNEVPHYFALQT